MKKIVFLAFFIFILILPAVVKSQENSSGQRIKKFRVAINVRKDAVIEVAEFIKYDFGPLQKPGLERNIPYIRKDSQGKKFVFPIKVDLILDEKGNKYKWTDKESNEFVKIKIGDADKKVSGLKTYIISYQVKGALRYFPSHDEFKWSVISGEWGVPIAEASVEVTLPDVLDEEKLKVACYTGIAGRTRSDCDLYHSGRVTEYSSQKILNPGEGLTIVLGFPKNIVSVVEPIPKTSFWESLPGRILKGFFPFLAPRNH